MIRKPSAELSPTAGAASAAMPSRIRRPAGTTNTIALSTGATPRTNDPPPMERPSAFAASHNRAAVTNVATSWTAMTPPVNRILAPPCGFLLSNKTVKPSPALPSNAATAAGINARPPNSPADVSETESQAKAIKTVTPTADLPCTPSSTRPFIRTNGPPGSGKRLAAVARTAIRIASSRRTDWPVTRAAIVYSSAFDNVMAGTATRRRRPSTGHANRDHSIDTDEIVTRNPAKKPTAAAASNQTRSLRLRRIRCISAAMSWNKLSATTALADTAVPRRSCVDYFCVNRKMSRRSRAAGKPERLETLKACPAIRGT